MCRKAEYVPVFGDVAASLISSLEFEMTKKKSFHNDHVPITFHLCQMLLNEKCFQQQTYLPKKNNNNSITSKHVRNIFD